MPDFFNTFALCYVENLHSRYVWLFFSFPGCIILNFFSCLGLFEFHPALLNVFSFFMVGGEKEKR